CRVYDVVETSGRPCIVMQLIDGPTLDSLSPRLTVNEKLEVMRRVAEAVAAAHELGIVHRDLKPSNVMVERAPDGSARPYVMDFALARELDGTLTPGHAGTPHYMAPEQARGETDKIDARTDVWALGATLYATLAGRPPFAGKSALAVLQAVENDVPAPLDKL